MARPALLCILDGWGWRPDHAADNAIAAAPAADAANETKGAAATAQLPQGFL
jgi:bisphosphoglycerate-independent phosphoglycerate mutase (AlkP superfamily)